MKNLRKLLCNGVFEGHMSVPTGAEFDLLRESGVDPFIVETQAAIVGIAVLAEDDGTGFGAGLPCRTQLNPGDAILLDFIQHRITVKSPQQDIPKVAFLEGPIFSLMMGDAAALRDMEDAD